MKPIPVEKRLWPKVEEQSNGCLNWIGTRVSGGYGQIWVNGKFDLVHRVVYKMLVGPIPEGMEIDHLCRNKSCCNPHHLEVVTRAENNRRMNAVKAKITKCRRKGHPLDELNTYYYPSGRRRCKKCHNEDENRRYHGRVK